MQREIRRFVVVLCLPIACAPAAIHAQAGSAQLTGVVRDQQGAHIPNVQITVTHAATNHQRTLLTNLAGVYTASGLRPGLYVVRADLQGFQSPVRDGIQLITGETVRVDFELSVGTLSEMLTATAEAPILQAERATLGQTIDEQRIVQLPLNGRTFISLAALVPGVALPPGSQLPRINGGRPRVNEYLYDGISVLQPEPGQVAFFPIIDAIQEFRIESNAPAAEFGRFNGGVINLATKSGSNALHGTVFEFLRNKALNARNFFASTEATKLEFNRSQFGGVFGGPVRRDRTFFFVDYQGERQRIGRTVTSTVPTVLQRQGMFSEPIAGRHPAIYDPTSKLPFPDNRIPLTRFDPVARVLLERYPAPTAAGTANNYRRVADETTDQDQFDIRIDHGAGKRDQTFARLSHFRERFTPVTPLPDGSGLTSGTLGPQRTESWALASQWQHTFSDRLLNELRVGETRRNVVRTATEMSGPVSTALGLPGLPIASQFANVLPTFLISGYQQLGSPLNTATNFSTGVTQLVDMLTWVRGRHTVKLGFDFRWPRLDVVQPPSPTGLFQFTSLFTDLPGVPATGSPLASFLLGQVQTFSIDVQHQPIQNRAHVEEYFVQDDWRPHDRLAVNAGVRYTLNFPSTEKHNQAAVFNLESETLEFLGRDGHPRAARRLDRLNLGPRLGIVARLSDRTVVRTGYGLVWIEQAGITTPFTTPAFPFLQSVSQRTLDNLYPAFVLADGPSVAPIPLTPGAGLGQGVFAVDSRLGSGYVQQWNVSLQRALSSSTSVEVAYVGSRITRVGVPDTNLNQLTVDQLGLGATLLQRVPNPYFGRIPRSSSLGDPTLPLAQLMKPYPQHTTVSLYRNNVGSTNYRGVEARIEHRLSRGMAFLASYTRSRLIDEASSVFDASILAGPVANYPVADSFDRRRERDYSTGDIPHVFVSSVLWNVRDWTLTGILTLQSGTPIAVTQATNFNAFAGFGTQRPNLIGNPKLARSQRTPGAWFNTAAFAVAPQFTLGNASRNPVRGPGYRNLDIALIRRIRMRGTASLEARVEVFNVANTPPLGSPNGVLGTPGFGSITTAGDPRVVQLAVKLIF